MAGSKAIGSQRHTSSRYHYQDPEGISNWRRKKSHDLLLTEGTALTSAIVDFIHGTLPEHTEREKFKDRIHTLVWDLIAAGYSAILKWERDALNGHIRPDVNDIEAVEQQHQFWQFFCELRRIFSRVCLSIDGELSENNLRQDPETSSTVIKALADIRFRLSSIVIEEVTRLKEIQFPNMEKNENGKWDAHWYEIALFQEITLILRSQRLAGAIETARFAIDFLNVRPQTDSDGGESIIGNTSFNPRLYGENPLKSMMEMSIAISYCTQDAAKQGLQLPLPSWLSKPMYSIAEFVKTRPQNFSLSSILHVESGVRVLMHNIAWQIENDESGRFQLCEDIVAFYNDLEKILESNKEHSKWIRGIIEKRIRQDAAFLLGNIAPSFLVDIDYGMHEDKYVNVESIEELNRILVCGWEREEDSPAIMRKRIRSALIKDMKSREQNFTQMNGPEMSRIQNLLGVDPTSTNPFTSKTGFIRVLWGNSGKGDSGLLHINQFPQSKINKAYVSILLGYLHCLKFNPEFPTNADPLNFGGGFFARLQNHIKWQEEDKNWRIVSKLPTRPQFTIGLFKKDKKENEKRKSQREMLTRVNKVDALMYIAASLNRLDELLFEQLGEESMQRRTDRAARNIFIPSDEIENNFHPHDLLHLAKCSENNPMRIDEVMIEDKNVNSAVEQIFRVSFARLLALSTKTEVLARILTSKPLREPYQSSCFITLDQIRVLLRFLHTDWKKHYDIFNSENSENRYVHIDDGDYHHRANELNNIQKFGHRSAQKNPITPLDRYVFPKKTDIATEFELSNLFRQQTGELSLVVERNHANLEFLQVPRWEQCLSEAFNKKVEPKKDLTKNQSDQIIEMIRDRSLDEHKIEDWSVKEWAAEIGSVHALERIKQRTDREWILWARLVFFPAIVEGKIIKSSTLIRSKTTKNLGRSLIWGIVKDAILDPMD